MRMDKLRKTIVMNLRKEGAKKIALFGSYARNQQNPKSDVDVLVEFKRIKSFLDLVRIERELSKKAGIKVDLLTEKAISPLIRENIKKEMKVIYK
ncbi:nucleotidyltransferase family protein [Candidatus Woesearchaeota archaeon]|nr:nucleotidyltransferase family protein [Candidatus Woesearchaeota archaeon]